MLSLGIFVFDSGLVPMNCCVEFSLFVVFLSFASENSDSSALPRLILHDTVACSMDDLVCAYSVACSTSK